MWVDRNNDIEFILKEDSRDKRRAANGAFHNSGRRGGGTKGIKGVKTTVDLLKANDKKAYKQYIQGGKIIMSSVYDDIKNIPPIEEIKKKDYEAAATVVKAAREKHTLKPLAKHWGVSTYAVYKLYDLYNVEYKRNIKKDADPKGSKGALIVHTDRAMTEKNLHVQQAKILQQAAENQIKIIDPAAAAGTPPAAPAPEKKGFQLSFYDPSIDGVEVQESITDYISILKQNKKYEIKLTIKELQTK